MSSKEMAQALNREISQYPRVSRVFLNLLTVVIQCHCDTENEKIHVPGRFRKRSNRKTARRNKIIQEIHQQKIPLVRGPAGDAVFLDKQS